MATIWYVDASGNRAGPVELTQAIGLVKTGMIGPTTLVWSEGMADWAPASQAPPLAGQFAAAAPAFAAAGAPRAEAPVQRVDGMMASEAGTWGLFWRMVVYAFGSLFIIPAPWLGVMWWGYLGRTTRMPDGAALRFEGRVADIWWVFILAPALSLAPNAFGVDPAVMADHIGAFALFELVFLALMLLTYWLIIRWFVGKLVAPQGRLNFTGGLLPIFGYFLLYVVSMITIIGPFWVVRSFVAWGCRHVEGPLAFEFRGTGFGILWRNALAFIACLFVIPIPWALAWLYRWFVSQIAVATR